MAATLRLQKALRPLSAERLVVGAMGVVDRVMKPQGHLDLRRLCGQIARQIQLRQTMADVARAVVVTLRLPIGGCQGAVGLLFLG